MGASFCNKLYVPAWQLALSLIPLQCGGCLLSGSLCFSFLAVDFFNQINMLYGTITDFCTEESCPVMSAGPK